MKRNLSVLGVALAASMVVLIIQAPVLGQGKSEGKGNSEDKGKGNRDGGDSEIQAGFHAVPPEITLNLAGKNRSLVYEGSYYVNGISDCVGCHNAPNDPMNPTPLAQRYLAGGTAFGPVLSRNLTPDATGKPAGLTLSEFRLAIREGRDWKNLPPSVGDPDTLIVMPWESYRHGTDRFIEAVYQYLSTLPCLPGGPAPDAATRCNGAP